MTVLDPGLDPAPVGDHLLQDHPLENKGACGAKLEYTPKDWKDIISRNAVITRLENGAVAPRVRSATYLSRPQYSS